MDLMAVVEPLMTSPALYPVVAGFAAGDVLFPIIPSEGAMIAAGVFAAATGVPNLPLVMAVAAAGAFIGDHLAYGLGRSFLGPRLIRRSRRMQRAVAAVARQLDRRGGTLIVTSRFVPGGRTAVTVACGLTGYPLARFSRAAGLAAVLWALYSGAIGFLGGVAFAANPMLGWVVGLGLSLAITLVVELVRRRAGRSGTEVTPAPMPETAQRDSGVCRTDLRTPTGHG
jgi:membrane protein DedA with SNARE-associated domain